MERFDIRRMETEVLVNVDKFQDDLETKDKIEKKYILETVVETMEETNLVENSLSKAILINTDEFRNRLHHSFDDISPLMYLSLDQRRAFLQDI